MPVGREVQDALTALTLRLEAAETKKTELTGKLEESNQQLLEARNRGRDDQEVVQGAAHNVLNDLKGVKTQAPEKYSGR